MKKHKSGHRIYTFVLNRKLHSLLVIIILFSAMSFGSVYLLFQGSEGIYDEFGKFCIDTVLTYNGDADFNYFKKIKLSASDIMRQASVFFTEYTTAEVLPAKSSSETGQAKTAEKPIKEKSIISNNIEIKNESGYEVNKTELLNSDKKYSGVSDTPKVLIVHTHGCETYSDDSGTGLGEKGGYRTTDNNKNMVKIGEVIDNIFKANNINVIHDITLCDYPAYNSSYVKALGVIEWYLERYPGIEFVFDIHRDAIEDENGYPTKLVCDINGKKCAQAMIVCGTDASGLTNPHWRENLALALKIQQNAEELYPGLMRPINLRKERFNMHKTKGSLLFEVGTHGNTIEEATEGAELLARCIAATLT